MDIYLHYHEYQEARMSHPRDHLKIVQNSLFDAVIVPYLFLLELDSIEHYDSLNSAK